MRRITWVLLCLLMMSPVLAQEADPTPTVDDGYLRSPRLGITFIGSADVQYDAERYERALALGAGWNRWPLYWDRVETAPGAFNWEAYDRVLQDDARHGLRTNAILLGAPSRWLENGRILALNEPIYTDGTDTPGPGKEVNPANGWATFVHAAVTRYADEVEVWEVWNEPDFPTFWGGSVGEYARLLKVAYIVAHDVDPDATVMFGGLNYTTTDDNWLARVLSIYLSDPDAQGNNWYMDAVAVHNYGSAWRSGWLTLFARRTLAEFGFDRPIWLNESGVPAWDDYPGPTWGGDDLKLLRATAQQQANFFVQSSAWAFSEGAEVVFYHQLVDDCGNQAPGTDFPPHEGELCTGDNACFGDAFGIYRNPADAVCFAQHPQPNTARPVAEAFELVAQVFGSERFSRRGIAEERQNGITVITFSRPERDQRVVVAWNTRLTPRTLQLDAGGLGATLYEIGERPRAIVPEDAVYTLDLDPAEPTVNPFLREWEVTGVGGNPLIIVESILPAASQDLQLATLELQPTAPAVPTTAAGANLSDGQLDVLIAESPTGVVFTSLNISRVRDRPDTSAESNVLGNIRPGETATVTGRTPDDGWYQIEYGGRLVWVASFLGELNAGPGRFEALPQIPYPE